MKKIGTALVLLVVGLFLVGCERPLSQAESILRGNHKLRKMSERLETNSKISGSFFLIVGELSGSTTTRLLTKFAWEMNDGTYALSSLPLEKIRVRFDERATTPTIKFQWRPRRSWRGRIAQVQSLMDDYVLYALVTVREGDWPVQVNLPLNQ